MRRPWSFWTFLCLVDTLIVLFGYILAFRLRFGTDVPDYNFIPFLSLLPYLVLLALIFFWFFELYSAAWKRQLETLYSVVITVLLTNTAAMALTFFLRGFSFPRSIFILAAALQIILLGCWRLLWQLLLERMEGAKNVVVIGSNGPDLPKKLESLIGKRYRLIGSFNGESDLAAVSDADHRGCGEAAASSALSAAQIVCLNPSLPKETKEWVISWCLDQDKEVLLVPEIYDILLHNAILNRVDDLPVFHIESLTLSPGRLLLKRLLDLILASVGLLLLAPLFLIIAAAVRLSSPGPVFYLQQRVGLNGKIFSPIKFRTMIDNAEASLGPVLASAHDPRITPLGRILRPVRLDEAPQLINVLKGEMSLVGPRPERPLFVEQYRKDIPWYQYRLKVKPGVTGLAQVQGKYDTDAAGKLRFDLYYIRNYSLLLDLQIIFQTLCVILIPETAGGLVERQKC